MVCFTYYLLYSPNLLTKIITTIKIAFLTIITKYIRFNICTYKLFTIIYKYILHSNKQNNIHKQNIIYYAPN